MADPGGVVLDPDLTFKKKLDQKKILIRPSQSSGHAGSHIEEPAHTLPSRRGDHAQVRLVNAAPPDMFTSSS